MITSIESAEGYDEDLAYLAAIYSSAAYCDDSNATEWRDVCALNPACSDRTRAFTDISIYDDPATKALGFVGVDIDAHVVVAAFKGTSEVRDWITDLSTWVRYKRNCLMPALPKPNTTIPEEFRGERGDIENDDDGDISLGQVHHGFCEYYQSLADLGLATRVAALAAAHLTYDVLLTGHSLGGAAATIAAVDLFRRFGVTRRRLILYTFGAPRTGDGDFAAGVEAAVGRAFRLVHRRDIVPHLAPCCHDWHGACKVGDGCPYHHSEEVWYRDDMNFPGANFTVCSDTLGEDSDCAYAVDLSVADHLYYFEIRIGGYCGMTVNATAESMFQQTQLEGAAIEAKLPPELLRRTRSSWPSGVTAGEAVAAGPFLPRSAPEKLLERRQVLRRGGDGTSGDDGDDSGQKPPWKPLLELSFVAERLRRRR